MAASTHINRAQWPRDLKIFALLASLWVAVLIARIVIHDAMYSPYELQAIVLGMRFEGFSARVAIMAQAMVIATISLGVAAERKWGLWLAFAFLLEAVIGRLVFMTAYLGDFSQMGNVRDSELVGIGAVAILLYLWIRARDLLLEPDTTTDNL